MLWTTEHPTVHKLSPVRILYGPHQHRNRREGQTGGGQTHQTRTHQLPVPRLGHKQGEAGGQIKQKQRRNKKEKHFKNRKQGITERIQRAMKKHHVNRPVKPHTKLCQILVHPEDQINPERKCDIIHEIPCLSRNKTYTDETERALGTGKNEHRNKCEKETSGAHACANKQKAGQKNLKSAISDHSKREKHITDWKNAKDI